MQINTDIKNNLTNDEKELFDILNQVVLTHSPSTTLRVAGGWVRDRLLGIQSNDIDIMVDNISGEKFAHLVSNHIGGKNPHVIKENPEKSKNIETAKAYITLSSGTNQEVDFAMARKEIYKSDSRIPTISIGTAADDAMRRDLSINSLFYNLKTNQIEDFTGLGIKDLITNTFRTPNDPLITFKEDPLRIFRVIRFAAKYGGKIDPNTYQAMQNPEIIQEVKNKVAKERIGQEFLKILKNPNPQQAIHLLKELGLLKELISESLKGTKFEGKMKELDMDQNNPNHELSLWEHTFQVILNTLDLNPNLDPEKRAILILSALTHDLGKLYEDAQQHKPSKEKHPNHPKDFYTSYHGHEDASAEIVAHILKYLKLEPYIAQVATIAQFHMRPHSLERSKDTNDKTLRKFIRELSEKSIQWLDVFNIALADACSKRKEIDPSVVEKYRKLENALINAHNSMQTTNSQKIQPVLNGNEIMQLLNIKPGPKMKEITDFIKDLQDENPLISKEEASSKIKDKFNTPTKLASKHQSFSDLSKIKEAINQRKFHQAKILIQNTLNHQLDEQTITEIGSLTQEIFQNDSSQFPLQIFEKLIKHAQNNFESLSLNLNLINIYISSNNTSHDENIKKLIKYCEKINKTELINSLKMNKKIIKNPLIQHLL